MGAVDDSSADSLTLLNRGVIEGLNARILEHGGSKLEILEQVKADRRDMFMLEWQNQLDELAINGLSLKVRLLPITRLCGLSQTLVCGLVGG